MSGTTRLDDVSQGKRAYRKLPGTTNVVTCNVHAVSLVDNGVMSLLDPVLTL